jgi:predicted TIM-barrel fold metal-dependent hydrolase
MTDEILRMRQGSGGLVEEEISPVFRSHARYLLDEFLADATSGHNVIASVYSPSGAMCRVHGPDALKDVGEVEFANGIAAMSESGLFGNVRVCAGILGLVDLTLADAAHEVLKAHIQAGGGRYRGVRIDARHDPDRRIWGAGGAASPNLLIDGRFRDGFRRLDQLGLVSDVVLAEPQLPDLISLAQAFPETPIVLNHLGIPLGLASYNNRREERYPIWRRNMVALAKCTNVSVKLGGLGSPVHGFKSFMSKPPFTSDQLAAEWRPYIEPCIETFGANRCMFESDFPADAGAATYPVIWNAFKRLTMGYSKDEKAALFSESAKRVYKLVL